MVDLPRLQSFLKRTVTALQRAQKDGDVEGVERYSGFLDRANKLAEVGLSQQAPPPELPMPQEQTPEQEAVPMLMAGPGPGDPPGVVNSAQETQIPPLPKITTEPTPTPASGFNFGKESPALMAERQATDKFMDLYLPKPEKPTMSGEMGQAAAPLDQFSDTNVMTKPPAELPKIVKQGLAAASFLGNPVGTLGAAALKSAGETLLPAIPEVAKSGLDEAGALFGIQPSAPSNAKIGPEQYHNMKTGEVTPFPPAEMPQEDVNPTAEDVAGYSGTDPDNLLNSIKPVNDEEAANIAEIQRRAGAEPEWLTLENLVVMLLMGAPATMSKVMSERRDWRQLVNSIVGEQKAEKRYTADKEESRRRHEERMGLEQDKFAHEQKKTVLDALTKDEAEALKGARTIVNKPLADEKNEDYQQAMAALRKKLAELQARQGK